MNGIKTLVTKSLLSTLLFLTASIQAATIWPDKVEPPVQLSEAIQAAKYKLTSLESDNAYCVNATLLNGENKDQSQGYWLIGFTTELGNSYNVYVRMDKKISVRKVKGYTANTPNQWPATVTPPYTIEQALERADIYLKKKDKKNHYCLNATLVTGSEDVLLHGMWNLVFQTTHNDPQLINVRMDGRTKMKGVGKLKKAYTQQ